MPISHRQQAFLGGGFSCDRWISLRGIVRRTEMRGIEQDERLVFETMAPPKSPGRGLVMIVLDGELRATVDGRSRTLESGAVAVVGARERLVCHGGFATSLEFEWALAPSSLGDGRLGARALDVVRAHSTTLRHCPDARAFAPHAVALDHALATEGILLRGLTEATFEQEDPDEQRYASALDAVLANLRENGRATGWEQASGMTRRTLTRQTHAFHRRYQLGGLGNRTDWRAVRDHYRAMVGLILLTHEEATVHSVAQAVGYGASTALCHSFAMLGLPPPGRVRKLVRAA